MAELSDGIWRLLPFRRALAFTFLIHQLKKNQPVALEESSASTDLGIGDSDLQRRFNAARAVCSDA